MATMDEITGLTKQFSDAHGALVDRVTNLNDQLEALKRRFLPGIKNAVEKVAETKSVLSAAIAQSKVLFEDPRTYVFHGIKVGMTKRKGRITIEDAAQVVKLIKKVFPDQAEVLIKTTEKPAKKALEGLPAADLKRLGISVTDMGDAVVITPTASDVDKIVKALLKGVTDEEEDQDEE